MSKNLPEIEICEKYINQNLSTIVLANMYGCVPQTITNILKRNKVSVRSRSEAAKITTSRSVATRFRNCKGEGNFFFGRKHSSTSKEKISTSKRGRKRSRNSIEKQIKSIMGSSNPNWRGGISLLVDRIRSTLNYKEWRHNVFKRDNFTCIGCGNISIGNIEADHIVPFSFLVKKHNINSVQDAILCEDLWNIENGRTLCRKCHKQTDTYGSKSRNYIGD